MKKRGELTSTQIGMLVIAIMGFLVVLFFILGFDFGGVSEREVCHLSVLTRGTSPEAAQMYIPLNNNLHENLYVKYTQPPMWYQILRNSNFVDKIFLMKFQIK